MAQISPASLQPLVTAKLVRELAAYGALPLPSHRESAVAAILGAWLVDANALSMKMSAAPHQTLVPVTVFGHPIEAEGEGQA